MAKRHMSLDLGATTTAVLSCGVGSKDDRRSLPPLDRSDSSSTDGAAAKRVQSDTWWNSTVSGGMSLSSRRERRSPTVGCKRPMAIGLPRLNLSLITEVSTSIPICSDKISVIADASDRPATTGCQDGTDVTSSSMTSSGSPSTCAGSRCIPAGLADRPTNILPFLFLGSQRDALSEEVISANRIKYVINVSTTSPQSPFVSDTNFLRIPVNDSHTDRLLPFFHDAFQFLDAVRESSGCVLVHCLAGISRSPTLVIAYVMRHLGMTTDQAYRYVKDRRPSISPNFNFLGQLVEYESQLQARHEDVIGCALPPTTPPRPLDQLQSIASPCPIQICLPPATSRAIEDVSTTTTAAAAVDECPLRSPSPVKRPCFIDVSRSSSPMLSPALGMTTSSQFSSSSKSNHRRLLETSSLSTLLEDAANVSVVQSPTTAMSKLNFDLQVVAGGAPSAAASRGSNRSKHVRLSVPSAAGVSNQLNDRSNVVADTTAVTPTPVPLLQTHLVHGSTSLACCGQADLIGAALNVTSSRDNHQLIAWTTPTRHQFALMYGRTEFETATQRVPDGHNLLWQQVQQATMKSRSFEDILMLSAKDSDMTAPSGWATCVRRAGTDLDNDEGDLADQTVADGSVVPSSLSGHGGSLHGSLEMIQVS